MSTPDPSPQTGPADDAPSGADAPPPPPHEDVTQPRPAVGAPVAMAPVPAGPPKPPKRKFQLKWWHLVLTAILSPILLLIIASLVLPLILNAMGGVIDNGGQFGEQEFPVERTDLTQPVTLSGTIAPTQRLDLSFAGEGEVTSVRVAVGDGVGPGTVLASIDDSDLRDAVTDAKAENDAAWKDYQDARKGGQATAINAMRSAYNVKAQALKEAQAALDKATLTSTIDGVVAAVNVQVGDLAGSAGGGVPGGGSSEAAVVVISRTFQVDATVGAADRGRVAKGMAATVTTSSSSAPLPGTVTAVGVVAEASESPDRPSAATFKVTVTLDGQPDSVFTGAAASVEVAGEGKTGVLAVPVGALIDRPSDTEATVMVRRGDETFPVDIKIGITAGDMVEVTEGLAEGDIVVVPFGMAGPGGGMGGPGGGGIVVGGAEPPR